METLQQVQLKIHKLYNKICPDTDYKYAEIEEELKHMTYDEIRNLKVYLLRKLKK